MSGNKHRIAIIKCGTTDPDLVQIHGDYDDWFGKILSGLECSYFVCDVFKGAPPPALGSLLDSDKVSGIIITGSPVSVRDELPFMFRTAQWAIEAAENGVPVLAVCLGHQLIGERLGGWVDVNPNGLEVGSVAVELTAAGVEDLLFEGLHSPFFVEATHNDIVGIIPESVVILASNDNTECQAFAYGPNLRGVQFHPEMSVETTKTLMTLRNQKGHSVESRSGKLILANWIKYFVSNNG